MCAASSPAGVDRCEGRTRRRGVDTRKRVAPDRENRIATTTLRFESTAVIGIASRTSLGPSRSSPTGGGDVSLQGRRKVSIQHARRHGLQKAGNMAQCVVNVSGKSASTWFARSSVTLGVAPGGRLQHFRRRPTQLPQRAVAVRRQVPERIVAATWRRRSGQTPPAPASAGCRPAELHKLGSPRCTRASATRISRGLCGE